MTEKTLATLAVWVAIFAYMWWCTRREQKTRLNDPLSALRPKHDRIKLAFIALCVAIVIFLFFTSGIGFVSDHTPYVDGVNVFSAIVALLGLYAMFVAGMFLSCRSKGQPVSHVFRDASVLLLQSAGIIALLFTVTLLRHKF